MNFIKEYSGVIALVILAILGLTNVFHIGGGKLGATVDCQQTTCLTGGLRIMTGTLEADAAFVANSVATLTGLLTANGGLTVTTSNTATSTTSVGCVQTTATSTLTPIALIFNTVSTSSANIANAQTSNGFVLWKYGNCPF